MNGGKMELNVVDGNVIWLWFINCEVPTGRGVSAQGANPLKNSARGGTQGL